jgi:hypothetical protein
MLKALERIIILLEENILVLFVGCAIAIAIITTISTVVTENNITVAECVILFGGQKVTEVESDRRSYSRITVSECERLLSVK